MESEELERQQPPEIEEMAGQGPLGLARSWSNRVRRNHALEHATLRVLAETRGNTALSGYSDLGGFWIMGEVDTGQLREAADMAMARLRAGEADLAIHPQCGTNYVVAGMLAGTAAWLGLLGTGGNLGRRVKRWPRVVSLATMALIMGRPLGPLAQKYVTTDAKIGDLEVVEITRYQRDRSVVHRVHTR